MLTSNMRGIRSAHPIVIELVTEACCSWGVVFGLEAEHHARLRGTKREFFCPNGHSQHYTGESDADRIKRLTDERDRARVQRDDANEARMRAERAKARAQAHLRAMRKRVAEGVCPVPGCKRSGFVAVARHVRSMHPDFYAEHHEELHA